MIMTAGDVTPGVVLVASDGFHRLECWCHLMIMTAGDVTPGRGGGGFG